MRIVNCVILLIMALGLCSCRMIPRDKLPVEKRLKALESEIDALGTTVDSLCREMFEREGKLLVRPGYTLESVAALYAVTPADILRINPQLNGDKTNVKPGVVLNVKELISPNQ